VVPSNQVGVSNPTLPENIDDHCSPLARYSAVEGALASGVITADLHHPVGHDLRMKYPQPECQLRVRKDQFNRIEKEGDFNSTGTQAERD
jgi:hypothetical protein